MDFTAAEFGLLNDLCPEALLLVEARRILHQAA